MQTYAAHYFSRSYRRVFGEATEKRPSKSTSGGVALPRWKSQLMFAAQGADGALLPSEVEKIKRWRLTDFFDLLEVKIQYAEQRAK